MAGLPGSSHRSEALRLLHERFRAASPATLARLRTLAAALAPAPDAPEALETLRRELHRVHGTAGSYGFKLASQLAADMEQQVIRWGKSPTLERDDRVEILGTFIDELAGAFAGDGK
jgi:HPt (histidine-containing phosphotransfer) domain-containing protein